MAGAIHLEKAEAILEAVRSGTRKTEVARSFGVSVEIVGRIASGQWFTVYRKREARRRFKETGNAYERCPLCKHLVKMPCLYCEVRVLPR